MTETQGPFSPGFSPGFAGGGAVFSLGTMIFRIAAELGARFDLAGAAGSATQSRPNAEAVRNAINTAISTYQKQRFRFNEITPNDPITFMTVAGQAVYGAEDSAYISGHYWLDYLNIQVGNTLMELSKNDPQRQHLNIQQFTQYGLPTSYAYEGDQLILYPVPTDAYRVWIGAHIRIGAPVSDDERNNPWMMPEHGELLIRCRAKYEVATHVTRNAAMSQAMSPENGETYRAWRDLKAEGNKVASTRGRIKAMQF
jgi:hypothetical protein